MKRLLFIFAVAFLAIPLSACSSEPVEPAVSSVETRELSQLYVTQVTSGKTPDSVTLLCVEDAAYVYTETEFFREGSSTMTRATELDARCE